MGTQLRHRRNGCNEDVMSPKARCEGTKEVMVPPESRQESMPKKSGTRSQSPLSFSCLPTYREEQSSIHFLIFISTRR